MPGCLAGWKDAFAFCWFVPALSHMNLELNMSCRKSYRTSLKDLGLQEILQRFSKML